MKRVIDRTSSSGGRNREGEEHEQARLVNTPEPHPIVVSVHDPSASNQAMMDELPATSGSKPILFQKQPSSKNLYANYVLKSHESYNFRKRSACNRFKFTPLQWILSLFPFLSWISKYNWKTDLLSDLVAGVTVCVMHIPQGMGYALLANLQPVVGIYMALYPVAVYALFGTSRHISIGTFAVVCLMTGKVATERMESYASVQLKLNDSLLAHESYIMTEDAAVAGSPYTAEQIATVLSFAVGIWQILLGFLKLGSLSILLSPELVSGFTTGAAIHVFISQVRSLLGFTLPKRNGMFKIPLTVVDIIQNFQHVNLTVVIFSIVAISSLVIYNEVIKPHLSRKIPFPIPVELFTIIVGTLISRYWITSKEYNLPIVNHIPTGLPTPSIPPVEILPDVILDALVIAIVAYTISISMAKIFAAKHEYTIGPNQEMIANGASNFVGSFFMCAPVSASLSRSLIQEQVGGKTQMTGLFSCGLLIFVLLWIGPFFETLPLCVLSAMIVVALKGMFLQFLDLPKAYRQAPLNALVWLAAFIATVVLDIEYGLVIGIIFSITILLWKSNKPYVSVLGFYSGAEVYVEASGSEIKEIPGVKIVKFSGCLNFATVEMFCERLQKIVPSQKKKKSNGKNNLSGVIINPTSKDKMSNISQGSMYRFQPITSPSPTISWIVLDLSCVSYVDPVGAKTLGSLNKMYLNQGSKILYCGCTPQALKALSKCDIISEVGIEHFFPSVADAVHYSQLPTFQSVPNFVLINNNIVENSSSYSIPSETDNIGPNAASYDENSCDEHDV